MTFAEELKITLIDRALIGGLLLIAGFILNRVLENAKHSLGLAAKRHELALKSQIEFKEKQLSDYYGPIYALLKQIRLLDDLWNHKKLGAAEKSVVATIQHANVQIVDIIVSRSHLVEGASMPKHFAQFLVHVAVWHAYMSNADADWSQYNACTEAHYDDAFENEVYRTTETLKVELTALREQASLTTRASRS